MIGSFRSKGLSEVWADERTAKIDRRMHGRILRSLDRLSAAADLAEMNVEGFDFHALRGFDPDRYSVHVNGPWCLTFAFADGRAEAIDFEQYH